jgi:hypothetical protein
MYVEIFYDIEVQVTLFTKQNFLLFFRNQIAQKMQHGNIG